MVDHCVPSNRTVCFHLPFVRNEVCHLKNILKKENSSCCGYNIGWLLSGKFMCSSRWTVYWESSWNHCTQDSWKKVFVRSVRSEVVWFHEIPCSCHISIDTGMSAFHQDVFLPAYHPLIHLSIDHHCGYCGLAWYTLAHHSHIFHSCNIPRSPCMDIFFLRLLEPEDDGTAVLWNRNYNPNSTM
jgi:hypothetical protein